VSNVKLHVLAGGNAGAEVTLTDGDWLIGTDTDADLTFTEPSLAGRQLRLTVGPGGVTLLALAAGATLWDRPIVENEEIVWEEGVPISIGTTRIALGEGPLREPPAKPEAAAAAAITPAAAWRYRLPVLTACGVLLLLTLPIGVAMWFIKEVPALPVPSAGPIILLGEANTVIHRLGLGERVSARMDGERLIVSGQVEDAAKRDALIQALRNDGLSPDMAVMTDPALADLVGTVLRAFAINPTVTVTGVGRVRIEGFAPDDAKAGEAVRRLHTDVPGLVEAQDRLATPARAQAFLDAELRAAGLNGKVKVIGLQQATVLVGGAVDGPDLEAWSALAERFQARFSPSIQLEAHLASVARASPRGVSLGRAPYVLLEDGQRLTIGASYGKGTIVGIGATGLRLRIASGDITVPFAQSPRWVMEEANGTER
jgi:type III secretion system YscD/HrpQ family protein